MVGLQKHSLVGSAVFGVATLMLGVIMLFIFPSTAALSEGFRTPIIAFEFAQTEADVAFLSGSDKTARENRVMMDAGHRWDMLFPFAYAGLITCLLIHRAAGGRRWLWLAVPVAVLIIPLDIRENLVLIAITGALENGDEIAPLLGELHTATWWKWGAMGASLGALALGCAADRAYVPALVSAIGATSIAACWLSGSAGTVAEWMSAACALFFLYFTVATVVHLRRLAQQAP